MASAYLNALKVSRDQLAATLQDITSNPSPSYSLDGESISWAEYKTGLINDIEKLNQLILVAQSPYWKVSKATS